MSSSVAPTTAIWQGQLGCPKEHFSQSYVGHFLLQNKPTDSQQQISETFCHQTIEQKTNTENEYSPSLGLPGALLKDFGLDIYLATLIFSYQLKYIMLTDFDRKSNCLVIVSD